MEEKIKCYKYSTVFNAGNDIIKGHANVKWFSHYLSTMVFSHSMTKFV